MLNSGKNIYSTWECTFGKGLFIFNVFSHAFLGLAYQYEFVYCFQKSIQLKAYFCYFEHISIEYLIKKSQF